MTRELAQKLVKMANDSLMAIRKKYVATEREISHEAGYIEGGLSRQQDMQLLVTTI